tara:strand:- start:1404 stop:1652 length:249 start_codon:yes stop_codon:yes gene_type:complete
MNTKPKLVDYSLFQEPMKKIVPKTVVMPTKSDNSLLINLIGLMILCIGGILIYQRYIDKEKKEIEKQNVLLGFHQYVKENIK